MNAVAQVLAGLVGLMLIIVGILESFFYRNPRFRGIFLIEPKDAAAVRLWVVNVGWYNMLSGVGVLVALVLVNAGNVDAGRAIVWFVCACHLVLGVTLVISEPRLWKSTIAESGVPLATMVALLF